MSNIPKKIYFTYKNKESFNDLSFERGWDRQLTFKDDIFPSWRRFAKGWEINFINDETGFEIVKEYCPEYYSLFEGLKKIEQIDLLRFICCYQFGGLFLDIDVLLVKNIEDLIEENDEIIVGQEFPLPANWLKYPPSRQLQSYAIFCQPKNLIMREILYKSWANCKYHPDWIILEKITGAPFNETILRFKDCPEVKILPPNISGARGRYNPEALELDNCYIYHCQSGSWKDQEFDVYTFQVNHNAPFNRA